MNAIEPRGLLTIAIDTLDANGPYQQRRTRASAEADAGLAESVRTLGILQPILVRWNEAKQQHQVVDGHRRVAAARAIGIENIQAVEVESDDRVTMAAGVAANLQRAALAPVDQWRAMVHLQDLGWKLEGAALALGIPMRLARQLDKLGRLHPDMLAAIEAHDMPEEDELAVIAGAPQDVQAAALKAKHAWRPTSKGSRAPDWYAIANACEVKRIPQSLAIFDPAKVSGIVWEEDLFAQPGAKDAITTRDIEPFLDAQNAALVARAARSKKLRVVEWDSKKGAPRVPAGWTITWDTKAPGVERIAAIVRDGYHPGKVVELHCIPPAGQAKTETEDAAQPPPRKESPARSGDPQGAALDATGDTDEAEDLADDAGEDRDATRRATAPTKARPPLTEKGRILLAREKTAALRSALRDRTAGTDISTGEVLATLVIALAGDNVEIRATKYGRVRMQDLAARLIAEDGNRMPFADQAELLQVARAAAAEAAARMLTCGPMDQGWAGSGAAAEWAGALLRPTLPRLDTGELLATVSGDALRAADIANGGTGKGTSKAIRERLAGNAPALRLPGAEFRAPCDRAFHCCAGCTTPYECEAEGACGEEADG
jgi:ParB/RepB/Spo0J family partition protein